jgi:hypothetical protein
LGSHEPRQFDVIEAIVIRHVGRGKLDQCHAEKKQEKECDREQSLFYPDVLPGTTHHFEFKSF